jgi:hypothetical protein
VDPAEGLIGRLISAQEKRRNQEGGQFWSPIFSREISFSVGMKRVQRTASSTDRLNFLQLATIPARVIVNHAPASSVCEPALTPILIFPEKFEPKNHFNSHILVADHRHF